MPDIVSRANAALTGRWIYFGYNAEYLFFTFCESRSVGEFTAFVAEERRASVMGTVIDLYAPDLKAARDAVSLQEAHLDTAGYYATGRRQGDEFHADQVELYGGLRWRYEEHVRNGRRRIDRIALFRATKGLSMDGELRLRRRSPSGAGARRTRVGRCGSRCSTCRGRAQRRRCTPDDRGRRPPDRRPGTRPRRAREAGRCRAGCRRTDRGNNRAEGR